MAAQLILLILQLVLLVALLFHFVVLLVELLLKALSHLVEFLVELALGFGLLLGGAVFEIIDLALQLEDLHLHVLPATRAVSHLLGFLEHFGCFICELLQGIELALGLCGQLILILLTLELLHHVLKITLDFLDLVLMM